MNRAGPSGQAEPKIKPTARPFFKRAWAGPKADLGPQAFWRPLARTISDPIIDKYTTKNNQITDKITDLKNWSVITDQITTI